MFGLFKKRDDFEFHRSRTRKLLLTAHKQFKRADDYYQEMDNYNLEISESARKYEAALRCTRKAHSALKEAIWNAQKSVQESKGDQDKLRKINAVASAFKGMGGEEFFTSPEIIELWNKSIRQWATEFKSI